MEMKLSLYNRYSCCHQICYSRTSALSGYFVVLLKIFSVVQPSTPTEILSKTPRLRITRKSYIIMYMKIIIHWFVSALIIIVLAYFIPAVHVSGFLAALAAALVIGLLNTFLKPILVILTLPISIITLGLFTLVINTLLVILAASIVPGFTIDSFGWAFVFSIVLSLVNIVFHRR